LNRESLLALYERFEKLIEKLPGGLQKPILQELVPIREFFLEQRPARILFLGACSAKAEEFMHRLCGGHEPGEADNGWRTYQVHGRGDILLLNGAADIPDGIFEQALTRFGPDLAVIVRGPEDDEESLEVAAARLEACGRETPLAGIAEGGDTARARLAALLSSEKIFSMRRTAVCAGEPVEAMRETICGLLPAAARLEFARMTGAKKAQAEIASTLLKSFTAVCGVIGVQPIPLADMPILTTLQTLMVGLIVHVSGKPVNPRLIAEFLGALGLNIGAGILFRESARALIKIVPFWGNAVSGFVAGAGTYAVGRAAIAYFIEETPIQETRKLFNRLLPGWDAFKRRRLPKLKAPATPPALPDGGTPKEKS